MLSNIDTYRHLWWGQRSTHYDANSRRQILAMIQRLARLTIRVYGRAERIGLVIVNHMNVDPVSMISAIVPEWLML